MKYFAGYNITGNPFFILSALCVLVGFQFICIGLLGEITIRTYYELQREADVRRARAVQRRLGFPEHSGKGVRGA